jgi:AraC-like DNA-binding protein
VPILAQQYAQVYSPLAVKLQNSRPKVYPYSSSSTQHLGKIDRIKEYIAQNYMNDISINVIAEKFDLTPNYLSRHFHEKAGVKENAM